MTVPPRPTGRLLSPARAATHAKLIHVAIELATEGGYDAVTIRTVAAAAELSVPTAYQHVSSKDQLLVEALLHLGEVSDAQVRSRAVEGATPAERMIAVFGRIMRQVARRPLLYQALYRAYVGWSDGAGDEGFGLGPERAAWIGAALRGGDTTGWSPEQLDDAATVLSTLFLGAMIGVVAGRSIDDTMTVLTLGVEQLLGSGQPK